MARALNSFLLLLFITSILFISSTQARPLNVLEAGINCPDGKVVYKYFANHLALGAIKESGPSPGGKGHRFTGTTTTDALGVKKNSGPSPGEGHSYINGEHH
ncbi:hypothetical protein BVC80_1431g39 [Macleaya cordata]|uniref:Uncharacterized protein n=1 Tax=Macleaya cordata TaxID=56857 RepID=A0A200PZT2_MACCD|nr:hypothetical protein BVC80_1431g39 [Macleaya cordata]